MNKIQRTLIETQFNGTELKGWLPTSFWYMIDSKLRTKVKLKNYLETQVANASARTKRIARSLVGKRSDDGIINILKWVKSNFKYKRDYDNYGKVELWADIETMMDNKADDCDGMNTVIYVLARLQGIPDDALYACIGNVWLTNKSGGHFWLVFWSPRHDKLVTIDSTYYPNLNDTLNRPPFKITPKRYQSVWYFFNSRDTLRVKS